MKLTLNSILSTSNLKIEVGGVYQYTLVELDTETGEAKRYKKDEEGKLEIVNGELVLEDVVFPIESLHVYLVKPK